MSTNVYLKDGVRNLPGFRTDNSDNIQLDGVKLFLDKGRVYIIVSDIDSSIPEKLSDLVDELTHYEWMPRMGHREAGVYRHESAECELIPKDPGGKSDIPMYWLKMKAKKLEDLRELLHRIKIGTIRPEDSYEGPQNGLSRKELEGIALQRDRLLKELSWTNDEVVRVTRALEEAQQLLKHSEDTSENHKKNFVDAIKKNVRIRQLARNLEYRSLPFVFRSIVVKQIDEILDDAQ